MVSTRSKSRCNLPPQQRQSPTWDCEHGSLPASEDSNHGNTVQSKFEKSTSPDMDEDSPSSIEQMHTGNRQSKNASSPRWLPWQDRFLASEALNLRPFLKSRQDTREAWEHLAVTLHVDSKRCGTEINRTGPACRHRFEKIIDSHRKEETRSLQKTGTNEEVDEHIQNLTDIIALLDAIDEKRSQKRDGVKQRNSAQTEAALELR
ncbi:hypothetical protein M422DRAFT_259023 [Sphaerobolus stellatus SS14]|uniref:Myb-like domain-containing protein n=1 Tax=Sphaerobolus stellatus (strain SS14) TaxID=990650 RepID=A0A0C9U5W2_SPHS4|nr:hypothetical protein M422DRAFT_259023 [Sphaerobolus stellatus SS14]